MFTDALIISTHVRGGRAFLAFAFDHAVRITHTLWFLWVLVFLWVLGLFWVLRLFWVLVFLWVLGLFWVLRLFWLFGSSRAVITVALNHAVRIAFALLFRMIECLWAMITVTFLLSCYTVRITLAFLLRLF
jgi:hypothetical protein